MLKMSCIETLVSPKRVDLRTLKSRIMTYIATEH